MKQEVKPTMTQANNNVPDSEDLELINTYTRNPISADEVYCFNLTLCDNEVDRDFERFSLEALWELCELFPGRTGICDHNMSSKNQMARIFKTWLEENKSKKTSVGENYTALRAKAYMLRTKENEELISQIEGGIKKEVSIGCSMKSLTCSICGKDMKSHECKHTKGKRYGKKLCHGILSNANDAYEWSFVAVPAQKNAGVTKAFTAISTKDSPSTPPSTEIPTDKALCSKKYLAELEELAEDGRSYRSELKAQIKKFALIAMPRVQAESILTLCSSMDSSALKALADGLRAQAGEIIPVALQLRELSEKKMNTNNNAFKI